MLRRTGAGGTSPLTAPDRHSFFLRRAIYRLCVTWLSLRPPTFEFRRNGPMPIPALGSDLPCLRVAPKSTSLPTFRIHSREGWEIEREKEIERERESHLPQPNLSRLRAQVWTHPPYSISYAFHIINRQHYHYVDDKFHIVNSRGPEM